MLFSRPKERLIILLEVKSSEVRGSLAMIGTTNSSFIQPQVLSSATSSFAHRTSLNSTSLLHEIERCMREVKESLLIFISRNNAVTEKRANWLKLDGVEVILSSPWAITEAKHVGTKFSKKTKITRQLIEMIISKERDRTYPGSRNQISSIEEKVFDVKLDGYSVSDWQDRTAITLEVSYATSVSGKNTIDAVAETFEGVVPRSRISFHSSSVISYIGLSQVMKGTREYVMVQVHGELTDISVMQKGKLVFFGSFPVGSRTLIRRVASTAKIGLQLADSALAIHGSTKLDHEHARNLFIATKSETETWTKLVKKLLYSGSLLAPRLILVDSPIHEKLFIDLLKNAYPKAVTEPMHELGAAAHIKFLNYSEPRTSTSLSLLGLNAQATGEL